MATIAAADTEPNADASNHFFADAIKVRTLPPPTKEQRNGRWAVVSRAAFGFDPQCQAGPPFSDPPAIRTKSDHKENGSTHEQGRG